MSTVSELIGNELANALTPHQHEIIRDAADEAPDGLRKVADEIRAAGTKLERPVAVLLNRINRGQHVDRQRTGTHQSPAPKSGPTDHRDWAQRLYATKLADLHRHHTGWTELEQRQHAIDYALDHCRAAGTELWAIEKELRAQHGINLTGRERDFERDTQHANLMRATHKAQPNGGAMLANDRAPVSDSMEA